MMRFSRFARVLGTWAVIMLLAVLAYARENVYHEGVLELSARQSRVIEDVVFHQTGDIVVRENSHLVIRNAHLVINQTYDDEFCIKVFDNGVLEFVNTQVSAEGGVRVDAWGEGEVQLRATRGDPYELTLWLWGRSRGLLSDSTISTLDIGDSASANLSSSTVEAFIRPNINQSSAAVFSDLGRRFLQSWSTAADVTGNVPFVLDITDCNVGGWGFTVGGAAEVEVINSSLEGFAVSLENTAGQVSALELGHHENWQLGQFGLSGPVPEVTLTNTDVLNWWSLLIGDNCHLSIADSYVSLTLLGIAFELLLTDSTVPWLGVHSATGVLRFDDSVICEYVKFYDSFIAFGKGVRVVQGTDVGAWARSAVFRMFQILVEDATGHPQPGVNVEIRDPARVKIFDGTTGENGQVDASVLFASTTWDKEFTVSLPELGVSEGIGFFGPSTLRIEVP